MATARCMSNLWQGVRRFETEGTEEGLQVPAQGATNESRTNGGRPLAFSSPGRPFPALPTPQRPPVELQVPPELGLIGSHPHLSRPTWETMESSFREKYVCGAVGCGAGRQR